MPRIRYQVAASLDGFIAGPNGEVDWIIMDPDIDFKALFAQYDTFLMGRGTYEASLKMGQPMPGKRTIVFSGTLQQDDHPDVTIIPEPTADAIARIRAQAERDIWLFGGGVLFPEALLILLEGEVQDLRLSHGDFSSSALWWHRPVASRGRTRDNTTTDVSQSSKRLAVGVPA